MRTTPTSNAGPMADIAFTLLIFFLVSTTITTDKGERVRLPRYQECIECDQPINDHNLLSIDILPDSRVVLENDPFSPKIFLLK